MCSFFVFEFFNIFLTICVVTYDLLFHFSGAALTGWYCNGTSECNSLLICEHYVYRFKFKKKKLYQ
jgi:hypothetical protein